MPNTSGVFGDYLIVTGSRIIVLMASDASQDDADQPRLDELIPLSKAAELSGLSQGHLSLLIREEKLWGVKIGRNWVTTEKAVREYLARDRRPGPKPQKGSGQSEES